MDPKVTKVYHDKYARSLILMDFLYDSWQERKRFEREKAAASGKRVVSSFTVREDDDFDEMFGSEGEKDNDGLNANDAKEIAERYGVDTSGVDL